MTDMTDAYENGAYIADAASFPPMWKSAAAAFRDGARGELDLAYGDGARQRLDLFHPEGESRGLAVFIHGGYWRAFDKSVWSHLAAGAVRRGWSTALVSYTLAPEARITAMTREVAAGLAFLAARVPGPIRLAGHSAGGHLATRMLCRDVLGGDVQGRIAHVLSISGLHDLRPLLRTRMNEDLRLDLAEARAESPALAEPCEGAVLTAWVGSEERPEFLRQSALIANIWQGLGARTALRHDAGRHHFDVIAALEQADSPITEAFVGDQAM